MNYTKISRSFQANDNQIYSIGLKELWQVSPDKHQPGMVIRLLSLYNKVKPSEIPPLPHLRLYRHSMNLC